MYSFKIKSIIDKVNSRTQSPFYVKDYSYLCIEGTDKDVDPVLLFPFIRKYYEKKAAKVYFPVQVM